MHSPVSEPLGTQRTVISLIAGDYSGYEDAPMSEAGDDGAEDDMVRVEVLVHAPSLLLWNW